MEKIALNVSHEVELYTNSDLEDFTAQLFLITKNGLEIAFTLKKENKNKNIFSFKIPDSLEQFLLDPVDYKVYVYIDNARFLADEGKMEIISQKNFTGGKLLNPAEEVKFTAKIKNEEEPKKVEKKEEPKKVEKKEEPKKVNKPAVKEESLDIESILGQQEKIKNKIPNDPTKAPSKSLRDYAARMERQKQLGENKEELNNKLRQLLSDFNKTDK